MTLPSYSLHGPLLPSALPSSCWPSLIEVFSPLGLHIIWLPGKTEVMVSYRGMNATQEFQKLRLENCKFGIELSSGDTACRQLL